VWPPGPRILTKS
jgi:leucyl aminopeptidase